MPGMNVTGAEAGVQVIPPMALAAAIIMVALGALIVIIYRFDHLAWKAQHTYIFDKAAAVDPLRAGPTCGEEDDDDDDDNRNGRGAGTDAAQLEVETDGVEGLDDGLSDTLRTSLLRDSAQQGTMK